MSKPIAVLITDIHFTLATLDRASIALVMAQTEAKRLNVPLVILGDTLDSKRIIAAEIANRLIDILGAEDTPETFMLVGNHDKINEKSEEHSLNFLMPYVTVVDKPQVGWLSDKACVFIPYQHDIAVIERILDEVQLPTLVLMHQGVQGSEAGHYIQDKTACPQEWFSDFRVISGHYHKRQDIKCGRPRKGGLGLFTYLGNPYTLGFGEANDPPKGYHILNDDGMLDFEYLELPEHVKLTYTVEELKGEAIFLGEPSDFVWVTITGTAEELSKLTKKDVAQALDIEQDFKLDLIPDETKADIDIKSTSPQPELLDNLISTLTNVSDEQKKRLKTMWKDFT